MARLSGPGLADAVAGTVRAGGRPSETNVVCDFMLVFGGRDKLLEGILLGLHDCFIAHDLIEPGLA